MPSAEFRCRSVAAAGYSLFFCFAKSKVSKRKGDPGVCVPPLRCGQPPVLSPAGVPLELGYRLRQSRTLFRLGFRSSAHSQGFWVRGRTLGIYRPPNFFEMTQAFHTCVVGRFSSKFFRFCKLGTPWRHAMKSSPNNFFFTMSLPKVRSHRFSKKARRCNPLERISSWPQSLNNPTSISL